MNNKRTRLQATLVGAAIACSCALFSTAAVASCSTNAGRYEQPQAAKPLIELKDLSSSQLAELQTYADKLKEATVEIWADEIKAESANASSPNDNARWAAEARAAKAAAKRIEATAAALGEAVSFRTIIAVGNGWMCSDEIKVQVPPPPNNLRAVRLEGGYWAIASFGEGEKGDREQGVFQTESFPRRIEQLTKKR